MRGLRRNHSGGLVQWAVMLSVLSAAGWGMSLTLPARADATGGTIPADVIARAEIAISHMHRIEQAFYIYANANSTSWHDYFPSDPAELYPEFIHDPTIFWHPGDSNPVPSTIDNSVPNMPNSARISFEYTYDPANGTDGGLVIRDLSAANNEGHFILEYESNCGGTTIPPGCLPVAYPVLVAQRRLRALGSACYIYANDNRDHFPPNALMLWTTGIVKCPRNFWHPADHRPEPTDIMTNEVDRPNSAQISFVLLGYSTDQLPNEILWQDKSPANNGGAGWNVVYINGHVAFKPIYEYNDYDGDKEITTADLDHLFGCMIGPQMIVEDNFCRHFDEDQDHDVDMLAVSEFLKLCNCNCRP